MLANLARIHRNVNNSRSIALHVRQRFAERLDQLFSERCSFLWASTPLKPFRVFKRQRGMLRFHVHIRTSTARSKFVGTEMPFYFIVGSQKSGTTWLRNCLRHFITIASPEWYYPDLFWGIKEHIERFGTSLPPAERHARAIRMAAAAWSELIAGCEGDKSAYPSAPAEWLRPNVYPFAISMAKQHFPNAKVALIIRDPRGVFNSLQHYLDYFRSGWSNELDATSFGANWSLNNRAWLNDKPDAVVRYEDLKTDFERELTHILEGLDIPATEEKRIEVKEREFDVAGRRAEQPEIYRTGLTNEWQFKLDAACVADIESSAGELMDELGYVRIAK